MSSISINSTGLDIVVMLLGSLNPEIQENNVADTGI
jgi:hypothetical protein